LLTPQPACGDALQRQEIIALVGRWALDTARRLFGLSRESLSLVAGYEGCANLVYKGRR